MNRTVTWLLALVLISFPVGMSAQNGSVRGVVVDENNKPVARATVSIDNPAKSVQADADGKFLLADVAPGRYVLNARAVGFQPVEQAILLKAAESLDIEVELTRITSLETNKVVGVSAARAEFDDRRAHNLGFVVDSSVLNNRADMFSALSKVPLTTVTQNSGFGVTVYVRTLGSRAKCAPAAYLDGIPTSISAVTALPPDHFRAIEVLPYETVPAKYMTGLCRGAILFWSKNVKW